MWHQPAASFLHIYSSAEHLSLLWKNCSVNSYEMGNCCCKCINKYISPKACHWCTFIFYHFRIISWSRFLIGGEMLNLERFPLSVLPCALCMHGLCSADVTAGGEPNPVSHTDSQAVLSALYWQWCALIRLEGQSAHFFFYFFFFKKIWFHWNISWSGTGAVFRGAWGRTAHRTSSTSILPPLIPTRLNDQIYLYHFFCTEPCVAEIMNPWKGFPQHSLYIMYEEKRNDWTEDIFHWHYYRCNV